MDENASVFLCQNIPFSAGKEMKALSYSAAAGSVSCTERRESWCQTDVEYVTRPQGRAAPRTAEYCFLPMCSGLHASPSTGLLHS